ncbi:hypothetical protein [Natrarchaeobaculum aegyptiacum]|uniref:Uncharacterized protein n=1 Tax=Natrarchaeobaculum aegyptiacum TaxID=745377 RepID=A0A2Z2HUH1_9EURY|nr:hypothetical protein [Natrarchaeobaculum aegyptiacum]ARS90810.1 hypothetical protein B1756_14495 [Natrarchaeobaculum aegyptiacum]
MGEERGERPDASEHEESVTDEPSGADGLEPTGGPRRVVSEESVDDVVASLRSTQTLESEVQEDRTDSSDGIENAPDDTSVVPPSEDDPSTPQSPPTPTAESPSGTVDLDDLSADAGPLAGRLQTDSDGSITGNELATDSAVDAESATGTGNESAAEAGTDGRTLDRGQPSESTRADDSGIATSAPDPATSAPDPATTDAPDDPATDAPDAAATEAPDDDQPSGLLARVKQFLFG